MKELQFCGSSQKDRMMAHAFRRPGQQSNTDMIHVAEYYAGTIGVPLLVTKEALLVMGAAITDSFTIYR